MCKTTVGIHHGNEHQNLQIGWFLRIVVDLINHSAISSTQQEVLGL